MTSPLRLTEQQLSELKYWEKQVSQHKAFRRLTAIRMKHNGSNNTEIARNLGVSRASIGRWIQIFKSNGFIGLTQNNYTRRRSQLGLREWMEIKEAWSAGKIRESWVLKRYVEHHYGISFNQNYLKQRARDKYGIRFRSSALPVS